MADAGKPLTHNENGQPVYGTGNPGLDKAIIEGGASYGNPANSFDPNVHDPKNGMPVPSAPRSTQETKSIYAVTEGGRVGELQSAINSILNKNRLRPSDQRALDSLRAQIAAEQSARDSAKLAAEQAASTLAGDAALRAQRIAENKSKNTSSNSGSTGSSSINSIERATSTTDYSKRQPGESVEQYRNRVGGRGEYIEADGGRFSGGRVESQGSNTRQAVLNSLTNSFSDLDTKESRSKGVREYNADDAPQGLVFDPQTGQVYSPAKGQASITYDTFAGQRVSRDILREQLENPEDLGAYQAADAAYSIYTLRAQAGGVDAALFPTYAKPGISKEERAKLQASGVPQYAVNDMAQSLFTPIAPTIEYRQTEQFNPNIFKPIEANNEQNGRPILSRGQNNSTLSSSSSSNISAEQMESLALGQPSFAKRFLEEAKLSLSGKRSSQVKQKSNTPTERLLSGIGSGISDISKPIFASGRGVVKQTIVEPYQVFKYQVSQIGVPKGSPERIQKLDAELKRSGALSRDSDVKTAATAEAFAAVGSIPVVGPIIATTAGVGLFLSSLPEEAETIRNEGVSVRGITRITGNAALSIFPATAEAKKLPSRIADTELFKRFGATEVPASEVFAQETKEFGGSQNFPLAKSTQQIRSEFEATRGTNPERKIQAVTASSAPLKKSDVAGVSNKIKKSDGTVVEDPGIYVAPLGRGSSYFLGIRQGYDAPVEFSLLPSFEPVARPSATIFTNVERVASLPQKAIKSPGYEQARLFEQSQANTGTIVIPKRSELAFNPEAVKGEGVRGGTSEVQAVIPETTLFSRTLDTSNNPFISFVQKTKGYSKYTIVDGKAVPLYTAEIGTQAQGNLITGAAITESESVRSEISQRQSQTQSYARGSSGRRVSPQYVAPFSNQVSQSSQYSRPVSSTVIYDSGSSVRPLPVSSRPSTVSSVSESPSIMSSIASQLRNRIQSSRNSKPSRPASSSSASSVRSSGNSQGSSAALYSVTGSSGSSRTPSRPSKVPPYKPPYEPKRREAEKKVPSQKNRPPKEVFKPSLLALVTRKEASQRSAKNEAGLTARYLPKGTNKALAQRSKELQDFFFKRK